MIVAYLLAAGLQQHPCMDARGNPVTCPPEIAYCRNIDGYLVPCYSEPEPPTDSPGDVAPAVPRERPAVLDPTLPTLPEVEPIAGMELDVSVGGVGAFTADTNGALKPFGRIRTATPIPIFHGTRKDGGVLPKWNPRAYVRADFTGLPGRTLNIVDIFTFNAIEMTFALGQPIFQNTYQRVGIFFEGGFATSLSSGTNEPMNRTQRWFSGGLILEQKQGKAWLKIGVGGDQRLDSMYWYAPAVMLSGSVRLWTEQDPNSTIHKVGVSLGGDASLGLGYGAVGVEPTRDLVRIWVGVSR